MTLPVSGPLSFNAINTELGRTATAQLAIDDAGLRTLFGVASGAIDLNTGYGKSFTTIGWDDSTFNGGQGGPLIDIRAGQNSYTLNFMPDGSIFYAGAYGDTYVGPTAYCSPISAGAGADYEMYLSTNYLQPADGVGGLTFGGYFFNSSSDPVTPWLSLSAGLTIQCNVADKFTDLSANGIFYIRKKSTGAYIYRNFNSLTFGYDY
jgi:hypothetical protein